MFLQRCRLAVPLTCALLLALPAVAAATYRGTNGKLAFANDGNGTFDIYSVSSTGSTLPPTPLTHSSALRASRRGRRTAARLPSPSSAAGSGTCSS